MAAIATARRTRLVAYSRAHYPHGVVHLERQRHRAPFAVLVENELGLGRSASLEWFEQLESPMVFVGVEYLPAGFVFVPNAPDPIARPKFAGELAGRFVQRDDRLALVGRITDRVPNGFGRVVCVGSIQGDCMLILGKTGD